MITKSDPVLRKSVPFFSVNAVRHEQIRLSKKTRTNQGRSPL